MNISILRLFLCFHCQTKLKICLKDEVIFISLLFRFLHCLNHIQLHLFMLSKVYFAILRPFLCFRCQTKLIIRLNDKVIFILLLRFLHSLIKPLLMLCKVNIAILRLFLFFRCLNKLIVRLSHEVIFISLLFRILHCLNHNQLPLFMLSKVNIAILRPFLCFHCRAKLIIRLNHEAIFISRILHCLNHIQLPLFMLSKVSIAIFTFSYLCSC